MAASSSLLSGRELCVMAAADKADLERRVAAAGGSVVQNPGRATFAVLAERENMKVRNVIRHGAYDVLRPSWLLRSLEAGRLLPFAPEDLVHATPGTQAALAAAFDAHGDSYTAPLPDTAALSCLLAKVEHGASTAEPEVADLVHEHFQEEMGCLHDCVLYFDDKAVAGDAGTRLQHGAFDLLRVDALRCGARIEEELSAEVSHVVVDAEWDGSRLPELRAGAAGKRRFRIVDRRWVVACVHNAALVSERPFAL